MKILLHACCGPCSLEPVRLLAEAGHELTLAYMNSNIHPRAEYDHRLATLRAWADTQNIAVVEGVYDDAAWHDQAGVMQLAGGPRSERCRRCYHMRLEEAAAYAAGHGFEGLATTLSVSPYQFTQIIEEELDDVCAPWGLIPVFEDFRPYYQQATQRSRDLGMYRQNYCGCVYSDAEAAAERVERAARRAQQKAVREAEVAPRRAAEEAARAQRARERAEYDRKQHAKKEARDAARARLRAECATEAADAMPNPSETGAGTPAESE